MTRTLFSIVALMGGACIISPEQFRDDKWCAALDDAAEEPAVSATDNPSLSDDDDAIHLQFNDFSYIPDEAGRKHIVSNEPIRLQLFDQSGQFATQVSTIDEHLCDDIGRRWIVDLEPQTYFFQLRAGDAGDAQSAVVLIVDDEDT